MKRVFIALFVMALLATSAQAQMRITEWMYNGTNGEFIEFTNIGASSIDMTGWSYDDDSRTPNTVSLSTYGTVAAGESVILTDALAAADFRTAWGLSDAVKVITGNPANLSRNDEINLYSPTGGQVDRLTFGDQNIPGSIRTQNISGNPNSPSVLGTNTVANWSLSFAGDAFGSHVSTSGDIGNPGYNAVPEPSTFVLLLIGLVGLIGLRRFRS
jgi:predicted extracellular nuclease